MFEDLGFNDKNFRAKNAAIPIIYYIYKHNLETKIYQSIYAKNEKMLIQKWLILSFLKGIFGGQTDQILSQIREVLDENINTNSFPYEKLIDKFNATNKNYLFDEYFIENFLYYKYGTPECNYILYLLYPDKISNNIHRDHMHPRSFFINKK